MFKLVLVFAQYTTFPIGKKLVTFGLEQSRHDFENWNLTEYFITPLENYVPATIQFQK